MEVVGDAAVLPTVDNKPSHVCCLGGLGLSMLGDY
jgi:hypothetical protein